MRLTQVCCLIQPHRELQVSQPIDFIGPGCYDYVPNDGWTALPRNDDQGYIQQIGINFPWLGQIKNSLYINTNGNLSFDGPFRSYQPTGFDSNSINMIAAFWADIDTRGAEDGHIWYKTTSDNKFVITWEEVARYGGDSTNPLRNTFQIVLSDASYAGDHICFCYSDMEWTIGSATHTGAAQVGIAGGAGHTFNLGQFSGTDETFNGLGTSGNGVRYLNNKSFCFNSDAINHTPSLSQIEHRSESHTATATIGGDPHITTWQNEHFEYHGQCDLTLVKDSNFADGLGLNIQIRTKLVRYWSYIKTVAIKIGHDILEIEGSPDQDDAEPHYWINFEYQGELDTFAGFPVTQKLPSNYKRTYTIDLSSKYEGHSIVVELFKEFVRLRFNGDERAFGNTVGLMGDYKTGKTLARDGVTELHDFTDFGDEWQVLPSEPKLFHEVSQPQFPELCIKPEDPRGDRKRRLAESTISIEQAEAACARSLSDPLSIKDCVYDILATQDMDMVGAF